MSGGGPPARSGGVRGRPNGAPAVSLEGPLGEAAFVERPNRFLVVARLQGTGERVEAHLPDPGRLTELLVPGRRLLLRPAEGAHRKTRWTCVLARSPDGASWVSVDTGVPNRLVARALERGWLEELGDRRLLRSEVEIGRSRIDFLLGGAGAAGGDRLALEVKSVTLVRDGVGRFPDAVTERGRRHVRELAELCRRDGGGAAVLFVVQRADARAVVADREIDPAFAAALAEARSAGVRALARRCSVSRERVVLGDALPVLRPGS